MANESNTIFKSKNRETSLRDPNYDGYRQSVEYVKQHGDQMHFATQAERRDYERLVNSNPQNVMGMPAFFPPMKLVATFSFDSPHTREMIAKGYWARCEKCDGLYNVNHYGHECLSESNQRTEETK